MVDTEREAFEAWNDSLGQESFGIRSVPNLPPAAWAAWQARAALASRPAEVDDEGLPLLPYAMSAFEVCEEHGPSTPVYTAEQYREGQRDAVAEDRARRGTIPLEITREMMRAIQTQSELGAYACANLLGAYDLIRELWRVALAAAASHTTNKEKSEPTILPAEAFGAVGDGVADDTEAFQLAVYAMALANNLEKALAAADAEKYDECAWDEFRRVFDRDLLNALLNKETT